MPEDTKTQLLEQFDALGKDIQELLLSPSLKNLVGEIGQEHNLNKEQSGHLLDEVVYVLLGTSYPLDLKIHLKEKLKDTPDGILDQIASKVENRIFMGVIDSLTDLYLNEEVVTSAEEPAPPIPKLEVPAPPIVPEPPATEETKKVLPGTEIEIPVVTEEELRSVPDADTPPVPGPEIPTMSNDEMKSNFENKLGSLYAKGGYRTPPAAGEVNKIDRDPYRETV